MVMQTAPSLATLIRGPAPPGVDPDDARGIVLAASDEDYAAAYAEIIGSEWTPGEPRIALGDFADLDNLPTLDDLAADLDAQMRDRATTPLEVRARYAQRQDANAAEAAFSGVGIRAIEASNLHTIAPPRWLLHDLLVTDSLAMLYGASGVGKSFLAADWAMTVATSVIGTACTWEDGGPVTYVAAEGAAGMRPRLDAWRAHHAVALDRRCMPVDDPLLVVPEAVDLGDPAAVDRMATALVEVRPALVVIDTLARCSPGLEENSARDMGVVVSHLDRLRRASGACVLVVHHSGKDGTAGARGSSVLRAAVDTEIALVGTAGGARVEVRKQKDAVEAEPFAVALEPEGDSAVMVLGGRGDGTSDRVLDALRRLDVEDGASVTDWRAAAALRSADFTEARSRLMSAGKVVNIGTTSRPRYRATT